MQQQFGILTEYFLDNYYYSVQVWIIAESICFFVSKLISIEIWLVYSYGCVITDQAQLDFEAKKLQSIVKEKTLIISDTGALADKISPGVLKSLVTLNDKPK